MSTISLLAATDVILRVSTIAGGALAVWTFWRSAKVRRAEWLSSLHAKFFESDNYKKVRRILDYETEPEFSRLRAAATSGEYDELVEAFVDYLNFFELIASLRQLGQVKPREVSMLFHYYLTLLCKHPFAREYVRTQDFENLAALLHECVSQAESRT